MSLQQRWHSESQEIPTVLLAASPTGTDLLAQQLPKTFATISATTLTRATALITSTKFNLILIGIFFDDYKMFELLQVVRKSDVNRTTPVVCFRPEATPYGAKTIVLIERALARLGANGFFDLSNPGGAEWQRFQAFVRAQLRPER